MSYRNHRSQRDRAKTLVVLLHCVVYVNNRPLTEQEQAFIEATEAWAPSAEIPAYFNEHFMPALTDYGVKEMNQCWRLHNRKSGIRLTADQRITMSKALHQLATGPGIPVGAERLAQILGVFKAAIAPAVVVAPTETVEEALSLAVCETPAYTALRDADSRYFAVLDEIRTTYEERVSRPELFTELAELHASKRARAEAVEDTPAYAVMRRVYEIMGKDEEEVWKRL